MPCTASCAILRPFPVGAAASSVLIVADPERIGELASALAEPLESGPIEVLLSHGGDDTLDIFHARTPPVVVITASLEMGDATSLIDTLRGMVPRTNVAFVVIGDDTGPIRTALDAMEMQPDRFVTRPVNDKAVRFAVRGALEAVSLRTTRPSAATITGLGTAVPANLDDDPTASSQRAALRARWEALADSIGAEAAVEADAILEERSEAAPLPPPIQIHPRGDYEPIVPAHAWRPGSTAVPEREPTLIIRGPDQGPTIEAPDSPSPNLEPTRPRVATETIARSRTKSAPPPQHVDLTERGENDRWSEPIPLAELVDRSDRSDRIGRISPMELDDGPHGLDDFADELMVRSGMQTPPPASDDDGHDAHDGHDDLPDLDDPAVLLPMRLPAPPDVPEAVREGGGRDFARQLRAKMSMMAQRLFAGDSQSSQGVDLRPRHDHKTEIDLAALGEEAPLTSRGVTEIERGMVFADARELTTSPGSWDTQVRERGLPDSGEVVRGVSDVALLLAKLFAANATGRVGFRRAPDEV
ncbi:hypothetical protein BH11MYX1_BH11MYX1_49880 [soil metagenome]